MSFRLPTSTVEDSPPNLYKLGEKLYNLGDFLLWDDRGDIGYGAYRNRVGHYYKGKPSPDHPSELHHWPAGILFMTLGQLIGTLATLYEMQNAALETESERLQ